MTEKSVVRRREPRVPMSQYDDNELMRYCIKSDRIEDVEVYDLGASAISMRARVQASLSAKTALTFGSSELPLQSTLCYLDLHGSIIGRRQ